MGRFDALTQAEEPKKTTPQPVGTPPTTQQPTTATPLPQVTKKPTKPQNRLSTKQSPPPEGAEKVEKYTTHIFPSLVKKVRLHAVENEMNDYEVVNNALLFYFEKDK